MVIDSIDTVAVRCVNDIYADVTKVSGNFFSFCIAIDFRKCTETYFFRSCFADVKPVAHWASMTRNCSLKIWTTTMGLTRMLVSAVQHRTKRRRRKRNRNQRWITHMIKWDLWQGQFLISHFWEFTHHVLIKVATECNIKILRIELIIEKIENDAWTLVYKYESVSE